MRILLATYQDKTIFQTMVPLAWALRTAGHEVRVACQPSFADVVTQAGLTAAPVGRNHTTWRIAEMHPENEEADRAGLPAPYDAAVTAPAALDWQAMQDGYRHLIAHWHKLDNFPMVADLVDFARHWRPDLVIWEATTYAGAIAAKACGAAHARLLWSIDVFGATRERFLRLKAEQPPENRADPLADWLSGYARKYGFDFGEDLVTGQFSIDQLPASLSMRADLDYLPMRYVPYGGPAVVPKWLWTPPQRPRVALTLGTTATDRFAGYTVDVQDILDALADLDIELVATIAENQRHKAPRVPDNTRVVSYVPLHALTPTCAAVINHAGPGTFLTTALHGVPQLTVPWEFDAPELARRAAGQGATLMLLGDRATGQAVRESVLRLLNEPAFRERAHDLRDEIHAQPTPNQLAPQLEKRAAEHR
ncbi:activator-dependent family glycosyltransferase [Streptosporangium amethystogenes subsp. fukuiense]|uniref:Activator-dependent family glycosyltransferase n=3 Tax=Streptosporangium amethystogenes TaxID=2002 RepID=A0ABW2T8S6_9ACTN